MRSLRSFFRSPPAAAPVSARTTAPLDVVEMLDDSVQVPINEAIAASTARAVEHRSTSYLGVLRTQLASLEALAPQFPEGIPERLVCADVETFATELARACTSSVEHCIRSADTDGSNALALFERSFHNAGYFTYEVHKQLIRGCDEIYHEGRDMVLAAYPQAKSSHMLDAPWWVARRHLLDTAYDALRSALEESASAQRRAMVDVMVFKETVENDTWLTVRRFWRTFSPVYFDQLQGQTQGRDWRETQRLRDIVTAEFIQWVIPDPPKTTPFSVTEDIAFAFACVQTHAIAAEEESLAEATERLNRICAVYGADAELDAKLEQMVKVSVQSGWEAVQELALAAARERALQSGVGEASTTT